ncbi:hypothetical protein Spb1_24490 [Planctopirus ephydatiae]|uniref:Uncharacterized protein n=1 Tax=Planctopirus ephydatiae TaxID=2528019 RepID=A0A518GPG0_9PLAN|nr:hypothetical protein Spb1_24490 [Planctopirus ephydatiae]
MPRARFERATYGLGIGLFRSAKKLKTLYRNDVT